MMKTLWDEAEVVANWWRQRPKSFRQYLAETREEVIRDIQGATDLVQIGRCQGRLMELDRQIKLEEDLNGILAKTRK